MTRVIKRLIDVASATFALVLLSPVMTLVALAIRVTMGSPVLFCQVRPGYLAKPFVLYKFRTMRQDCGADGHPLPDSERVTRLGRLLRQTSLDELPQLWNVLRGDMSLIGPRPLLMEYLPLYTHEQRRRHEVKPGLTGLAQVKGRNRLGWDERFCWDVWYVDHWSLWLDARILWKTGALVLSGADAGNRGETMPPFSGSPGEAT